VPLLVVNRVMWLLLTLPIHYRNMGHVVKNQ